MFGGVKITLILCLTIVVSSVLFISYNEYLNRYELIATNDNSVYIFDKRSTVLNRCDNKGCNVIETKLPSKSNFSIEPTFQQSKMFDQEKPMANETIPNSPKVAELNVSVNQNNDIQNKVDEKSTQASQNTPGTNTETTANNIESKSEQTSNDANKEALKNSQNLASDDKNSSNSRNAEAGKNEEEFID